MNFGYKNVRDWVFNYRNRTLKSRSKLRAEIGLRAPFGNFL